MCNINKNIISTKFLSALFLLALSLAVVACGTSQEAIDRIIDMGIYSKENILSLADELGYESRITQSDSGGELISLSKGDIYIEYYLDDNFAPQRFENAKKMLDYFSGPFSEYSLLEGEKSKRFLKSVADTVHCITSNSENLLYGKTTIEYFSDMMKFIEASGHYEELP